MRRALLVAIVPALIGACAQVFGAKDINVVDDDGGGIGSEAGGSESGVDGPPSPPPAPGDDGGPDADAATCDLSKPFGKPQPLAQLQTGFDWSARFTADELTMFVWSDRSGSPGSYSSTRGGPGDTFPSLSPIVYGGDGGPYLNPAPSADGMTLIVEAAGAGGTGSDLYEAKRSTPGGPFGTPTPIGPASSAAELEAQGYLLSARGVLYFMATPSGVPTDLYKSSLVGGVWQPRVALDEINTTFFETFPTLTPDEKTIYFGSDRNGNMDIWVGRRNDTSLPFGSIAVVAELSTAKFEVPTWVSADGCRLVYRRNTVGTADNAVFMATRGL
jgi:hypothetical protein